MIPSHNFCEGSLSSAKAWSYTVPGSVSEEGGQCPKCDFTPTNYANWRLITHSLTHSLRLLSVRLFVSSIKERRFSAKRGKRQPSQRSIDPSTNARNREASKQAGKAIK